jgi:hypothetical protein
VLTIGRVAPGPMEAETPDTAAKSKRRDAAAKTGLMRFLYPRVGRRYRVERHHYTAQISEMARTTKPGNKSAYLARHCIIPHHHGLMGKICTDGQSALRRGALYINPIKGGAWRQDIAPTLTVICYLVHSTVTKRGSFTLKGRELRSMRSGLRWIQVSPP